jgi:uncharacterized protein (DUF2062 family)
LEAKKRQLTIKSKIKTTDFAMNVQTELMTQTIGYFQQTIEGALITTKMAVVYVNSFHKKRQSSKSNSKSSDKIKTELCRMYHYKLSA